VELSLYESGVTYSGPWLIDLQLGNLLRPLGNRHPRMAPHGVYPCAGEDQWLAAACRDDRDWRALCGVLTGGLDPDWGLAQRRAAEDAIDDAITAWTRRRTKEAAALDLRAAGVPAGPVNTTPDILADPQIRHRGYFVELEESLPVPGVPFRMQSCPGGDWTPCPRLGADNRAVLEEWLGYDGEKISALERAGTLADRPPP
jgi:crotonobetainyl-CoA:carnitine CoA-transferase CaiB-like acyl-CoA transferase